MEEFHIVLNQVIILFIILIIGFVAGKFKIMDSFGTKKLSEVLLFITSPMMVFNSFFIEFSQKRLINLLWIIIMGGGMFLISIIVSKFIYKGFDEKISPVLRYTAIFSNCGNMGIPLMMALFGEDGVFYGSFYIVIFHTVLWSYGYMMFGGKGTKAQVTKNILTNPSIIAVYIGMIIFIFGISIPDPVRGAVKAVGDMTMPISMLVIGGLMSTTKLSAVFNDWRVYMSSAVRLVLMPLIAIFISRLIGAPALPSAVVATALAMPAATTATMFSEKFDKDAVFASKCVTVSTLLSIITAPLLISFVVKGLL